MVEWVGGEMGGGMCVGGWLTYVVFVLSNLHCLYMYTDTHTYICKHYNVVCIPAFPTAPSYRTLVHPTSTHAHLLTPTYTHLHPPPHTDTSHTFNGDQNDWGFNQFLILSDVRNNGFLINDTIIIKVCIRTTHYEPYNSKKETGFVGLKNQGATCYMNSLLQTLYNINRLRQVCVFGGVFVFVVMCLWWYWLVNTGG